MIWPDERRLATRMAAIGWKDRRWSRAVVRPVFLRRWQLWRVQGGDLAYSRRSKFQLIVDVAIGCIKRGTSPGGSRYRYVDAGRIRVRDAGSVEAVDWSEGLNERVSGRGLVGAEEAADVPLLSSCRMPAYRFKVEWCEEKRMRGRRRSLRGEVRLLRTRLGPGDRR